MNMMTKLFAAAALATASMSAHAVQADITVWADVDPTLALLKADGTPLSDVVELAYRPGTAATAGLTPWTERVRVFSNDIAKDITVSLGSDAALLPESTGGTAAKVDLRRWTCASSRRPRASSPPAASTRASSASSWC